MQINTGKDGNTSNPYYSNDSNHLVLFPGNWIYVVVREDIAGWVSGKMRAMHVGFGAGLCLQFF